MRLKTTLLALIGLFLAFGASTAFAGDNKYADKDYVKDAHYVYFDDESGELLGNSIVLAKIDDKLQIFENRGANAKILCAWANPEVKTFSEDKVITGTDADGNDYKLTIAQVGRKKYQLWIERKESDGDYKTTKCINITSIEFSHTGVTFRPSKNVKTGYKLLIDWLINAFFIPKQ
ncbi:MAG: hypothetical protein K2K82_02530 [Muribaculaceae bacterium]|nr:hypothetical protein [Muribaculaceae bacterium]